MTFVLDTGFHREDHSLKMLSTNFEGKTCFYPDAPKLPKERVEQGFAFDNISIDYAGPVYVKDQYSDETVTHKAWIALITCRLQC